MKNKLLLLAMGIVLSAQTLMAQVPSYVPTNGLVGYWPFSGNANDASGNGNNGTVNGATLTTDRNGNANSAYGLTTLTDNLTVSNTQPAFNNNALSVSLWMKFPTQYNQSSLALVKNGIPYTNGFDVAIDQNNSAYGVDNYLVLFLVGNGVSVSFISNQAELGNWSNIVSTYDGSNIKIYLNGVLKATQAFNQSMNIPNNNLVFGAWDNPTTPIVKTREIDDIGIWNRALTQQEITSMYNGVSYNETCNNVSGSLTQGLVGYWPFCGNANDDSGNGNNGTVNGATLTTDRFGNVNSAYSFDGVNDFINMPSGSNTSLNITTNLSLSFWFKTTQSNNAGLIGFGDNLNGLNGGFLAAIGNGNSGNPIGKMTAMSGNNWYTGTNILTDNNWHFACITISGNTMSFYIDNVLDSQFNNVSSPSSFNGLRAIGARNNGLAGYFDGQIDDIGIWNRALTPTEVTQLYNQNQCFTNTTVTDTLIINVGQLSFTNPIAYANNITIAPNPASAEININFNTIADLNGGMINIINSLGQQVATTPITLSGTQTSMQLATWGGAGMYFVQIINPQGQIVDIKKIILQ